MHEKFRFILVIDEAFEDIEHRVKAERCVDEVEAFLSGGACILCHQSDLFNESGIELHEMRHRNARTV